VLQLARLESGVCWLRISNFSSLPHSVLLAVGGVSSNDYASRKVSRLRQNKTHLTLAFRSVYIIRKARMKGYL